MNEDPNNQHTLELLETLRETPPRDSNFAAHGKTRFLAEARYLQKTSLTVSLSPILRLSKWMSEKLEMAGLSLNNYRKEHSLMFTAISSIILVFAVLLGGSSVTAYAAQDSLPNDLLYPVKLFLEDTRYTLTSDAESQVELLVAFANNRIDEILGLAALGEPIPDSVLGDLQTDLDTMMQVAADIEDGEIQQGALRHIQDRLRTQDYVMKMTGQPEDVDPALEQLRQMLQAQHQRAAAGLEDPLKFQHMFKNNQDDSEETTDAANGNGNTEPGNADPGNADPGNADPGNADPGNTDPGNTDPGNTDPGNADPGNTDPGNTDPGDPDPGNTDPGDPDPGNTDPGDPDPGEGEPGDPDPGNPDPGNPDPGNPDPGDPDPGKGGSGSGGGGKP
jgi:hypothetical protein